MLSSKAGSLFSLGKQSQEIASSIGQSGINSHLNPAKLAGMGASQLAKAKMTSEAASFSLQSVNAADVLAKMITKESSED